MSCSKSFFLIFTYITLQISEFLFCEHFYLSVHCKTASHRDFYDITQRRIKLATEQWGLFFAFSLENLLLVLMAIYLEIRTTGCSLVSYLPFWEIN